VGDQLKWWSFIMNGILNQSLTYWLWEKITNDISLICSLKRIFCLPFLQIIKLQANHCQRLIEMFSANLTAFIINLCTQVMQSWIITIILVICKLLKKICLAVLLLFLDQKMPMENQIFSNRFGFLPSTLNLE
jgi:hypothetical protein